MPNQESLHYKNKERLAYRPTNHTYWHKGDEIPTVSKIAGILDTPSEDFKAKKSELLQMYAVKQALIYVNEHRDTMEWESLMKGAKMAHHRNTGNMAKEGTAVHKWCQEYIENALRGSSEALELPTDPAIQNGAMAFLNWITTHQVKFLASEQKVLSKKHRYAGTTDFLAVINGVRSVGDFKTGRHVHIEADLQLAGYKIAINEEFPDNKVIERWVIHLDKYTGEFGAFKFSDSAAESLFPLLVKVYNFLYDHKGIQAYKVL